MRLTRQKRALSLLLALAAVLSLMVLPGGAVRFLDVDDARVSLAADTLAALGVVGGTGDGKFSPEGHLTRAQLCKMAVELLGMREQAEAQAYRTIFADMGKHWARGYVNVAATTEVPEKSGVRLMLGLGDGRFGPDQIVTYQEAVTLALRILEYGTEANRAWPHSAVETAALLGLDQDIQVEDPAGPITRGQASLLFYNMLTIPAKGQEKPCADKLGQLKEDAILLTANATVNGQEGWAVVAQEDATQTYPCAGSVDQALMGKRGWAMLDKEGRFITLLPDESSSVTAAVERKQAYYLYLKGQGRYTLSEDTPVYTGSAYDAGVTTYKEYMANLRAGDLVTLYLDERGQVAGLYRAEASTETSFIIVRGRTANYGTFRSITNGEQGYAVRKNGATVPLSAIKQYDVATYDPVNKVLEVCDVRLTCMYENASPSPGSPSKVTAAGGNQFDVMADGISSFAGRKIGDQITLMFTASGKVAGVLPKEADNVTSLALGVQTTVGKEEKFQVLGCKLTLMGGVLRDGAQPGDILNASSAHRGDLALTPAGTKTNSKFNTADMLLDKMRVSSGVQVYEQTLNGMELRSLPELPATVTVSQYHRDNSGLVDLIIVNGYSGDGYKYGRIDAVTGYELAKTFASGKTRWVLRTVQGLLFTRKDGSKTYPPIAGAYHASGYGTVLEYEGSFAGVTYLEAIENVNSSDFFTQEGVTYVRTKKGVFPVAEDVQCFNGAASGDQTSAPPAWVQQILANGGVWDSEQPPVGAEEGPFWSPDTGDIKAIVFDSLGECRNFSDTVTVYIDSRGRQVRVVEAK